MSACHLANAKRSPLQRRPHPLETAEPNTASFHLAQRATTHPAALTAQDTLQLQRLVGNRATCQLLAPYVQRAVSPSATWQPQKGSPEAGWITQLDGQIPNAEQDALDSVQTTTGLKTPRESAYLQRPSAATWGSLVEEKLNVWAANNGWQTQVHLRGARPDYYRDDNGVEVYVDLTTVGEAGVGGNHITSKLQNANVASPDPNVSAADITHLGLNPNGLTGGQTVLGNATLEEMQVLQNYQLSIKSKDWYSKVDSDFNPLFDEALENFGKVKHHAFTQKWGSKKRKLFVEELEAREEDDTSPPKNYNLRPRKKRRVNNS